MLGAEVPPGTTNCAYLKQPDKQELAIPSGVSYGALPGSGGL